MSGFLEPDQHVSKYTFDWLREYAYDSDQQEQTWHPRLWDASIDITQLSHQLDVVQANDQA